MDMKLDRSDLDVTYHQLLRAQEEFAGIQPGEKLSSQSHAVISKLIAMYLLEINVMRLQYSE